MSLVRAPIFFAVSPGSPLNFIDFASFQRNNVTNATLLHFLHIDPDMCCSLDTYQLSTAWSDQPIDSLQFSYTSQQTLVCNRPDALKVGPSINAPDDILKYIDRALGFVISSKVNSFSGVEQFGEIPKTADGMSKLAAAITAAIKNPVFHPAIERFQNVSFPDCQLFDYSKNISATFYKALAAGHNSYTQIANQQDSGNARMREVNFQTGSVFAKCINLSEKLNVCLDVNQLVKSDQYYLYYDELSFLFRDVQVLSHCRSQVSLVDLPQPAYSSFPPTKHGDSLFQQYFQQQQPKPESAAPHLTASTSLMQRIYSSKTQISAELRQKFFQNHKVTDYKVQNTELEVWYFLVRDKFNCYAIISAISVETNQFIENQQVIAARSQDVSYPAMKIAELLFGDVPLIDQQQLFHVVDIIPFTNAHQLDVIINDSSMGASFFIHSAHWALSAMKQTNSVDDILKSAACVEFSNRLNGIFETVKQRQDLVTDVTHDFFIHKKCPIYSLEAVDILKLGLDLEPQQQMNLLYIVQMWSQLSVCRFIQLTQELICQITNELLLFNAQSNSRFYCQIVSFTSLLLQVLNIAVVDEVSLYILALSVIVSSRSKELLKDVSVNNQEEFAVLLEVFPQFRVDPSLFDTFASDIDPQILAHSQSLMSLIFSIIDAKKLIQQQIEMKQVNTSEYYTQKAHSFLCESLQLFTNQSFSAHIFGKPTSELAQKFGKDQCDQNDLDQKLLKAFQDSGIIFTSEMLQKQQVGKGAVPIGNALLVLNFDASSENLEVMRNGQTFVATQIKLPSNKIDVAEFDDSIQDFVELPGSQFECWASLANNSRQLNQITTDTILAYLGGNTHDLLEVNALKEAVDEAKKLVDADIVLLHTPLKICFIANVCGVKRLLYQSTVVVAASRSNVLGLPNLQKFIRFDLKVCTAIEYMVHEIIDNQLTVYENGFLTLNSSIDVQFKYQIQQDSYEDFQNSQSGFVPVEGKPISRLSISSMTSINTYELFQKQNNEQAGIIVAFVGATQQSLFITQSDLNPGMLPMRRVKVSSSYYLRKDQQGLRRCGNGNIAASFKQVVNALTTNDCLELKEVIDATKFRLFSELGQSSHNYVILKFNLKTQLFETEQQDQTAKSIGFSPSRLKTSRNYQQYDDAANFVIFVVYFKSLQQPSKSMSRYSSIQYVQNEWFNTLSILYFNQNLTESYVGQAAVARMNLRSFFQVGNFTDGKLAQSYGEVILYQKQLLQLNLCLRNYGDFIHKIYAMLFKKSCQYSNRLSLLHQSELPKLLLNDEEQLDISVVKQRQPSIYRDGLLICQTNNVDLNRIVNYLAAPLSCSFVNLFTYGSELQIEGFDLPDFILPYVNRTGSLCRACELYSSLNQIPNLLQFDGFKILVSRVLVDSQADIFGFISEKKQQLLESARLQQNVQSERRMFSDTPENQFDEIKRLLYQMIDRVANEQEQLLQTKQFESNYAEYQQDLQTSSFLLQQAAIKRELANAAVGYQDEVQKHVQQFRDFSERSQELSSIIDEAISLRPVLADVAHVNAHWQSKGLSVHDIQKGRPHLQCIVQQQYIASQQLEQQKQQIRNADSGFCVRPQRPAIMNALSPVKKPIKPTKK